MAISKSEYIKALEGVIKLDPRSFVKSIDYLDTSRFELIIITYESGYQVGINVTANNHMANALEVYREITDSEAHGRFGDYNFQQIKKKLKDEGQL